MSDLEITEAWPPTTAAGLARVMHENNRTMGESTGDFVGRDWNRLGDDSRARFMHQAEQAIASGEFIPASGWQEDLA